MRRAVFIMCIWMILDSRGDDDDDDDDDDGDDDDDDQGGGPHLSNCDFCFASSCLALWPKPQKHKLENKQKNTRGNAFLKDEKVTNKNAARWFVWVWFQLGPTELT